MNSIVVAILLIILVLISVSLGYAVGRVTRKHQQSPQTSNANESNVVLVKRNKPSFRSPLKTSVTAYDEYKTSKGLYAPIKPGKGSKADEIDLKV